MKKKMSVSAKEQYDKIMCFTRLRGHSIEECKTFAEEWVNWKKNKTHAFQRFFDRYQEVYGSGSK